MTIDPKFRDMAASLLDEFTWPDLDVRRAREVSLAERLQLITEAEIADLRRAESKRIMAAMMETV